MEPKYDDTPPQDQYDDRFKKWRRDVQFQRRSDLEWLAKLSSLVEAEFLSGEGYGELDNAEKDTRANVRWYMDLLRWKHDLVRWEREDIEWEKKLQVRDRSASREDNRIREWKTDEGGQANGTSTRRANKNRQHRKRNRKPDNQSVN